MTLEKIDQDLILKTRDSVKKVRNLYGHTTPEAYFTATNTYLLVQIVELLGEISAKLGTETKTTEVVEKQPVETKLNTLDTTEPRGTLTAEMETPAQASDYKKFINK